MKKKVSEEENKAIQQLKDTTTLFNQAEKQLDIELKRANQYFADVLGKAESKDLAQIVDVKRKADALIKEAKKGGNIEEIVKELNNLGL